MNQNIKDLLCITLIPLIISFIIGVVAFTSVGTFFSLMKVAYYFGIFTW